MPNAPSQLSAIAERLRSGEEVAPETVRTLLSWFDAQRRGYWIVKSIREAFQEVGVVTIPDLESTYIDGDLHFALATTPGPATTEPSTGGDVGPGTSEVVVPPNDPTYRLARLPSANRPPLTVTPDGALSSAITQMINRDFSQLPVMEGERTLKGVVSWASIGKRLGLGVEVVTVRDCMEPAHVVERDASLFSTIEVIVRNDYVLVKHPDNRIGGIVTTADLSIQFRELAEPYLLVGEIENHLRHIIARHFGAEELRAIRDPNEGGREVRDVADLTFGEYLRLVEADDRWQRRGLRLDRRQFVKWLEEIRDIRNDVMHFDPDPLAGERLDALRSFARLMQTLRQVGAV